MLSPSQDPAALCPPDMGFVAPRWELCGRETRAWLQADAAAAACVALGCRAPGELEAFMDAYGPFMGADAAEFDPDAERCSECGAAIGFIFFMVRRLPGWWNCMSTAKARPAPVTHHSRQPSAFPSFNDVVGAPTRRRGRTVLLRHACPPTVCMPGHHVCGAHCARLA
jgi:hypothetical protein